MKYIVQVEIGPENNVEQEAGGGNPAMDREVDGAKSDWVLFLSYEAKCHHNRGRAR